MTARGHQSKMQIGALSMGKWGMRIGHDLLDRRQPFIEIADENGSLVMTARGPLSTDYDRDDIAFEFDAGDVPFVHTEESVFTTDMLSAGYADGDDYTWDASKTRTELCDERYRDLAGIVNGLRARVAELERTIAQWTGD